MVILLAGLLDARAREDVAGGASGDAAIVTAACAAPSHMQRGSCILAVVYAD
jgi:hypothetical protein